MQAELTLPESNGRREGFLHKLKLIYRYMYRRGKADLVRQRMLNASLREQSACLHVALGDRRDGEHHVLAGQAGA